VRLAAPGLAGERSEQTFFRIGSRSGRRAKVPAITIPITRWITSEWSAGF
jgi:hypothetical protein